MPITPSLRHCSNKYKGREGGKDKDEDIEKGFLFFMMKSSSVERDDFSVVT